MRKAETNPWRRFLAIPNERPAKALGMAALVGVAAALVVSVTSVLLQPLQLANIEDMKQRQMQNMLSTLPGLEEVLRSSGVDSLQSRIVDLDSGSFADQFDVGSYNMDAATSDESMSIALSGQDDIAGIVRRANYAPVHLLQKQGSIELVVLPVYGTGYQSTIRAWLTLAGDLKTVVAFSIYEQGETPGLGSRIEAPEWQALWNGKEIYDQSGAIALRVSKGKSDSPYSVDGITGATRTGNGINHLLAFWLGDKGFGRFLQNLRANRNG